MVNLPPPKAKGLNPWHHFSLQYKTFLLLVRLMAGQSVEVNIRRAGGLSQALTQNFQIKGKFDSFPPRFDLTDYNDSNLSKTEKSLPVAAVSTNAQQITIQKRDDEVYELGDRFDVATNVICGGSTFETRLKEGYFNEDAQPTVDLITDPYPFMITTGEKRTMAFLMSFQCPYSVNVQHSIVSLHRISTEALGGSSTSIAGHERTSGRLAIPADGDTTTLDVQAMESGAPESKEKFLIAFNFEGHTPITPKHGAINTFTSDCATKNVVVKLMDDDTPQPSQHLVYLHGSTSDELTNRPQAALKDGENTELSLTRISDTALSDVPIPLEFKRCPADTAISSGDRTPASMPIESVQESGSMTLQTTDDSMDKGYSALRTVNFDDTSECWLSGNTRVEPSRFVVVMSDNDKTPSNLLSLGAAAFTEAVDARRVMCQLQLTHRPKADPAGTNLFGSVSNDEGIAGINR